MADRVGCIISSSKLCIYGGSRGAAFANTFQTIVFMIMGLVAFTFIINALGGINNAGKVPARINEKGLIVQDYRFDKQEAC